MFSDPDRPEAIGSLGGDPCHRGFGTAGRIVSGAAQSPAAATRSSIWTMGRRLDGGRAGDADDKWFGMIRIGATAAVRMAFAVGIARIGGAEVFASFVALSAVEVVALTLLSAGWITPLCSLVPGAPAERRGALLDHALRRSVRAAAAAAVILATATPIAVMTGGVDAALYLAFCASTGAWLTSSATTAALATRFANRRALLATAASVPLPAVALAWAAGAGVAPLLPYFIAQTTAQIAASAWMRRAIPRNAGPVDPAAIDALARHGRVVLVGSVANSLCTRVQPFVLAAVGGAAAVSGFGAANTLVGPARVVSGAVGDVLRPRLALHQGPGGEPARGRRALGLALAVLGSIAAVLVLASWFAGDAIGRLVFGPDFASLGRVLPWAAAFAGTASLANLLVVAMQSASLRGARVASTTRTLVALLSLAAVWPACALDGARGAFVAMTFAEALFLTRAAAFVAATPLARAQPAVAVP